ncbi:MAG: cytidylate kinase [Pelotomaculum sp. PtaU1.Bin035]|nr:MAG: cytidylate kinase [Pelotomaculum sp. PtaU1.Bin035]
MSKLFPNISITGDLGSGKSTISSIIARKLNFQFFSIGEIQRQLAIKYNMTILEFNNYIKTHPEIDIELDNTLTDLGNTKKCIIFDSRMAWHFVPNSFKICLIVDLDIAAERIINAKRGMVETYSNKNEAKEKLIERRKIEKDRYLRAYNKDITLDTNYDLIIDTSFSSPEQISNIIISTLTDWHNNKYINNFWLAPKRLYPTLNTIRNLDSQLIDNLSVSISKEGLNKNPIIVFRLDQDYFIYDGHHRTAASILNNLGLIPISLLKNKTVSNITLEEFVKGNVSLSLIYDWEKVCKFKYIKYPEYVV